LNNKVGHVMTLVLKWLTPRVCH